MKRSLGGSMGSKLASMFKTTVKKLSSVVGAALLAPVRFTIWSINKLFSFVRAFFLALARIALQFISFTQGHLHLAIAMMVAGHFVLAIFNPFNIAENADDGTANTINAIFSPGYGGTERTGQNEIAIVLIQPESMSLFGDPFWPPAYDIQANIDLLDFLVHSLLH